MFGKGGSHVIMTSFVRQWRRHGVMRFSNPPLSLASYGLLHVMHVWIPLPTSHPRKLPPFTKFLGTPLL